MAIIDYKLKVVFVTSETRYGRAFLGTFAFPRARAPRFFLRVPSASIFPSRSAFLYNIFFRFPCAHAFMFCVPSVCVGVGDQLITCAQCVHGLIRLAGSTRHRGVYVQVYWGEAGLGSNLCLVHNPPFHLSSQYTS